MEKIRIGFETSEPLWYMDVYFFALFGAGYYFHYLSGPAVVGALILMFGITHLYRKADYEE